MALSVAPVPDILLYDSIYQERYMGLPTTDAEVYRVNSPIHFAEGLADQVEGSVQNAYGQAKDAARDAADKAKDALKGK